MPQTLNINGTPVYIEGQGDAQGTNTVVMIHGWPDTHRLWDSTVAALQSKQRCVRFSLPGFDVTANAPHAKTSKSLQHMVDHFKAIVDAVSPNAPVTLLIHDWGCIFGYEFAAQHPKRVSRIAAVDIGDHNSGTFLNGLSASSKFAMLGYQLWLAIAWKIGGNLGNRMSQYMAKKMRCPSDPAHIGWQQNYPYAMQWLGLHGGFKGAAKVKPTHPMLYIYGARKPFMFQSQKWLDALTQRTDCHVESFPTGHWVMSQEPARFNQVVGDWLDKV